LEAIAFPGLGLVVVVAAATSAFVFVGDGLAVAGAEGIDAASESEFAAF
jgi:hypothetical protein